METNINDLSFEDLLVWCCSADETVLRNTIKSTLTKLNFSFKEDDYKSYRSTGKFAQENVHNLLFTRGNPKYCLVAHTDVCRDHTSFSNEFVRVPPTPTFKMKNGRRILQDKDCEIQVGGDDRVGVTVSLWIAMHTEHDLGLLYTTDEEVGLISADYVQFPELKDFKLLIQIDRGNHSNQIVPTIGGVKLCDQSMLDSIFGSLKNTGFVKTAVVGRATDVLSIKANKMCQNAINLTCGYYDSIGDSGEEYIDVEEAKDTAKFVRHLIVSNV